MYYVVYGLLWMLSLLPLRVLYLLSDAFYGLVFYVFKYRRDVVMHNLQIAFPEKTELERIVISKKFYHNLIDTFIETIKMISVSDTWLEKRFSANWELINDLKKTGKSVQLQLGHNFNWEWGNAVLTKKINFKMLAVYMPFSNKIFERLFYKLRTRCGAIFLRATSMRVDFLPYRNTQYVLGLVADQNPGHPNSAWWVNFFGKPTPFLKGPAKGAILNDTAVVYAFIHKPRRGYYRAEFFLAEQNPVDCSEQELTKKFVHYMEEIIRSHPDMWLWSHRRWKWEWKKEYGEIIN